MQRCFGPYFIILAKNQSFIFPTFSTLLIKVAKQKLKKRILPIPTATNILQSSEQKNKTKKVKKLWESAAKSLLKTTTSKINKKDTCKKKFQKRSFFGLFVVVFKKKVGTTFFTQLHNFFSDFRGLKQLVPPRLPAWHMQTCRIIVLTKKIRTVVPLESGDFFSGKGNYS